MILGSTSTSSSRSKGRHGECILTTSITYIHPSIDVRGNGGIEAMRLFSNLGLPEQRQTQNETKEYNDERGTPDQTRVVVGYMIIVMTLL